MNHDSTDTLLLVDDEVDLLDALDDMLKLEGFEVF